MIKWKRSSSSLILPVVNQNFSQLMMMSSVQSAWSTKCTYFEAAVLRRRLKQQFLFNCHLGIVVSVKLSVLICKASIPSDRPEINAWSIHIFVYLLISILQRQIINFMKHPRIKAVSDKSANKQSFTHADLHSKSAACIEHQFK